MCLCNVTLLCDNVTELWLTILEDHHDRTAKILPDASSALQTRLDVKEIKHQKLEKRSVFLLSELSALISLQHRNRITCVRANTLCPRGHPGRSAAYRPLVKDTTLSVHGKQKTRPWSNSQFFLGSANTSPTCCVEWPEIQPFLPLGRFQSNRFRQLPVTDARHGAGGR